MLKKSVRPTCGISCMLRFVKQYGHIYWTFLSDPLQLVLVWIGGLGGQLHYRQYCLHPPQISNAQTKKKQKKQAVHKSLMSNVDTSEASYKTVLNKSRESKDNIHIISPTYCETDWKKLPHISVSKLKKKYCWQSCLPLYNHKSLVSNVLFSPSVCITNTLTCKHFNVLQGRTVFQQGIEGMWVSP